VVDWSGGVFASCMPRVQLYVNACNGWPQFALQHYWLLPINCNLIRLYSAAGRGVAVVSSAIEESDFFYPTGALNRSGAGSDWRFSTNILLYLKNGARYGHSYCGTLIELVCPLTNSAISSDLE